jgi:hypothetical protein
LVSPYSLGNILPRTVPAWQLKKCACMKQQFCSDTQRSSERVLPTKDARHRDAHVHALTHTRVYLTKV